MKIYLLSRKRLFLLFILIGIVYCCEDEIKEKLKLFGKGKNLKELFAKYAPSGFMDSDEMDKFLLDADVSDWCRWPTIVIEKLDLDNDEKLAWDEVETAFKIFRHEEL